jgi:putative oxidoreductase
MPYLTVMNKWKSWSPQMQSILRIFASAVFITAGTMKLFAFPAGVPPNGGTVPFMTQAWIGGVLETFLGSLILIGLFTRPAAFILSGEMAVAYFQFHFPASPWPTINMGMSALIYCFVWLYFSAAGAGPWSIDAIRNKGH